MSDCFSCRNTAAVEALPIRERIWWDGRWRIAHAIRCALPGWVVVIPARHILSPAELTPDEAASLGPLLAAASRGLEDVTGCRKVYLALFAEGEGFQHLHIHVVPRYDDQPPDRKGPSVFGYLQAPESECVPSAEMDRIGAALAERIALA
ncbi:MAG TPA: HIT family protein [Candidatus Dormibacteraeota bacterium]|nr:HIT family protein [Candidatus Dormibacteraeota bacterium]